MRREKTVREALYLYLAIHARFDHKVGEGTFCHVCTKIRTLQWVLGEVEDI